MTRKANTVLKPKHKDKWCHYNVNINSELFRLKTLAFMLSWTGETTTSVNLTGPGVRAYLLVWVSRQKSNVCKVYWLYHIITVIVLGEGCLSRDTLLWCTLITFPLWVGVKLTELICKVPPSIHPSIICSCLFLFKGHGSLLETIPALSGHKVGVHHRQATSPSQDIQSTY